MKSPKKMSAIQMIAIGSSAGGIDILKKILIRLPKGFIPSIIVVQHIGAESHQTLAQFFSELCQIPVKEAEDKEKIDGGTVYFAPSGYHLLVEENQSFALNLDPLVNFARPSIDVLMETAAAAFGEKMMGVILTGANQDGAAGIKKIGEMGGITVAQDPLEAAYSAMPQAAIDIAELDYILTSEKIVDLIAGLH